MQSRSVFRSVALTGALLTTVGSFAQSPPAPSPAKQAVAARKAVYTLVGQNFKPIGDVLQGRASYDAAEIQKRASRVAFLAGLASDTFPQESAVGLPDSKAKASIWTDRAAFDQRLKDFQEHAAALVQVSRTETAASDAFKRAATAVAQDCKGCHDNFKEK